MNRKSHKIMPLSECLSELNYIIIIILKMSFINLQMVTIRLRIRLQVLQNRLQSLRKVTGAFGIFGLTYIAFFGILFKKLYAVLGVRLFRRSHDMAEMKQYYITQMQDNGAVMISQEVIAAIVVNALKDVDGIIGIGGKLDFDLTAIKNWAKALNIVINEENNVRIDCNVIAKYGLPVIEVAKAAQDAITSAVEDMTGVKPSAVNVSICGISRQ